MTVQSNGSRKFLYITVCIGNLVALSSGIALGWSSPVNVKLKDVAEIDKNPLERIISDEEDSWISSILALGAGFGPVLAGFLADKIGRKKTLLFCSGVPLLVSYLMLAFAQNIVLYYIARFIAGFALGGVFTVLPNLISEISENSVRGVVSSSMNFFILSGILYSYIVGTYTSIMWFNISCAVWPALFVVLFFILVPESPYYLIAAKNSHGAIESLKKLRSSSDHGVMTEFEEMKRSVDEAMSNKGSFLDIFKSRGLIKAFIISLSLVGFQQLSGINVVLFNTQTIFSATGSDIPAEISTIIVGVVQLAASFVTPLAVEKLGRKYLLLISAVGMFSAEVPLGLYFYFNDGGKDVSAISWMPITCLILYIILYNWGFGPLPWVVMAEVFPPNVKSSASTATASFCWVLSFVLTKFFTNLKGEIGMAGSFWLFSGFCGIAIFFVIFYMIETTGKSFQEIQDVLAA